MSNVTFQLLGQNVNLNPQQLLDLGQADQDLNLIATEVGNLQNSLHALPDGTLISLALNNVSPKWTPSVLPGSPATFSLQPTASFTLKLQSTGPLFTYFTDFDQSNTSTQATIDPAPGKVYLIVEAEFGISGSLSGSGTIPVGIGVFNVSGIASAGATYTVQFFKAFDPSTAAGAAILDAVRGFSLPLHNGTANNLQSGDALYYEFDGNLKVGFGASYGITASVASQSLSGVSQGLNSLKQAVNLSGPGATFNAQAALAINANLSRKFHCILQRTGNSVTLHLFKGTDSDFTEAISVSGGISNVSTPSITFNSTQLANAIAAKLPSTAGAAVQFAAAQTASLQQAASNYIDQANKWLSSLAQKVNENGQISLSLQFEQAGTNASAFGWQFDMTQVNFPQIWSLAMSGDYFDAYSQGQGTVTLMDGSGFETTFKRNTQVTLSFFGLGGTFTSLNSYYGATTVTFRSGIFCFETNAGRMETVQSGDGKFSSTLYLDCLATNATGGNTVAPTDLTLHGIVSCTGETSSLANFGVMLHAMGIEIGGDTGAQALALGDIFRANAAQRNSVGEGLVHFIYAIDAVNRIRFDAYTGNKQQPRPHLLDQANWNDFSSAFQTLPSSLQQEINGSVKPSDYQSFQSWEFFNCYANGLTIGQDGPPNSQMTDRRNSGNIFEDTAIPRALTLGQQSALVNALPAPVSADLIAFYEAGRLYMNLCDDLKTAATVLSGGEIDWPTMVNQLKKIANQDMVADYAPQVMLALLQSTQAQASNIQVVSSMTDQNFGTGSVIIQVQ
jgi:hypothetical protein